MTILSHGIYWTLTLVLYILIVTTPPSDLVLVLLHYNLLVHVHCEYDNNCHHNKEDDMSEEIVSCFMSAFLC